MTQSEREPQSENSAGARKVSPKLLEILICPISREKLVYDREANELISKKAKLAYPIRDGVPIMLPDEARELD